MAKYGKAASKTVKSAMRRRKSGTLKSGSGRTVKSREAGDRHRIERGPKQGREGAQAQIDTKGRAQEQQVVAGRQEALATPHRGG